MIDYEYGFCRDDADRAWHESLPVLTVHEGLAGAAAGSPSARGAVRPLRPLPALEATVPFWDEVTDRPCGRAPLEMPASPYPWSPGCDARGHLALDAGALFYREGMERSDPAEHELRIACFQAAELFYLHAAARGNVIAHINLGYVYSYDRCEGAYWDSEGGMPFDRDARAFACYDFAAQRDDAEACYKLGDLLQRGRGCEMDLVRAFAMYCKAARLADEFNPTVRGSAALRIASCREEGVGCEVDFAEASRWYGVAERELDYAVRLGDWYYKKQLARARAGARRVAQELDGTY